MKDELSRKSKRKEKYKTETTRNYHGNPKEENEKDENALRERI